MTDDTRRMLIFAELARLSHERQQSSSRDRFLLLCGRAALHAAELEIAETCRQTVIDSQPRHLIGQEATLADHVRSAEHHPFWKSLDRFITAEQAEHLLIQNEGLDWETDEPSKRVQSILSQVAQGSLNDESRRDS